MKFLIWVTTSLAILGAAGVSADYDLEKIVTVEGAEYREILVIESDIHGLTFRHLKGIAKLPFSSLPTNLRMLYEATVPLEAPEEEVETEETADADSQSSELVPLVLTVRTRVFPAAMGPGYRGYYGCGPVNWPSAWPRFNPALLLSNPYCREMATRDFLYTSGLLPKPRGVFTYRLPHNRPYWH